MTPSRRIGDIEINALVDGELTPQERAEVETLLAAAPAEQALARDLRDLNEALKTHYAGRLEAPVPQEMLRLLARIPRWSGARALRWAALAAVVPLLLTAGLAGFFVRALVPDARRAEPSFVANAIGAHSVFVPEIRHPVEVKAAEEHLVRWLTKRVGAPIRAPSLAGSGWKLMGGRLLPDHGMPAAQFMYEDAGGRRFTLYICRVKSLANTSFQFAERDGLGAFYWVDRPLAYALAGNLDRNELMGLANTVYTQLEQR